MHITTPCPQIMIFEIVGNFFFGSLDEIETKLLNLSKRNVRVIIIHMKGIEFIDSASVLFLRRIINHYNKIGVLIILSGVKIGKGSVIAAGSVVTKNIPSMCIAAGNPAKIIRKKKTNE